MSFARQWDLDTDVTPHAFIQWKGTNVCLDFHCECGTEGHLDGYFAYSVKCPTCGQEWEMPSIIYPRKSQRTSEHGVLTFEADDD